VVEVFVYLLRLDQVGDCTRGAPIVRQKCRDGNDDQEKVFLGGTPVQGIIWVVAGLGN
jgi:hypothetical protein